MFGSYSLLLAAGGAGLLLWAFAARRSWPDALILGAGGLLLLVFVGLRRLAPVGSALDMLFLPELVAGALGLVLLVWSFLTSLRGYRIGYRLSGCAMLVPLVLLALLIFLFSLDNHHLPE